uniref:site-specific DNA-methyltransferase (cytosine-N(4)-specific) n=2 Tax=viral metagenome TaxID=1070528 RepID=A0A6H2A3W0_9ZZZZ
MTLSKYEYYRTENGVLYHGDCLEIMPHLEPVDLVLTSPPYDNLRIYGGHQFDFETVAKGIKRVLKIGGICVWVVGDETKNGCESLTSFKQAIFFVEFCGLNLHDTMIYFKDPMPLTHNRYEQANEYMFVFSKGKPKTFNPLFKRCSQSGQKLTGTRRHNLNDLAPLHKVGGRTAEKSYLNNVWHYSPGFNKSTKDKIAYEHPAIFPEQLAADHILSWSNEGDIVMDTMSGSGTVAKMAERLNRRWIGIEIEEKYCAIAKQRIENERKQRKLF